MKIERFEDVRAWWQARELASLVYDLTGQGNFSRDFRWQRQRKKSINAFSRLSA